MTVGLTLLAHSMIAVAGVNLAAIGRYADVPYKRAHGRESFSGGEIIYEFNEPNLNFGRIVVRSRQPLSVVRRDLFVGFTGQGLTIDARGTGRRGRRAQVDELEIWLRLAGAVRPGRRYEWEVDADAGNNLVQNGFPAVIPFLWADGEAIGAEATVRMPASDDTDRIRRLVVPHGRVEVEAFDRQTGGAWLVLKPEGFGGLFTVRRVSFREAERVKDGRQVDAAMPVPIRYVPIGRALATEISGALDRGASALREARNEENHWTGASPEESVDHTALILAALADVNPGDASLAPAMQWLAAQQPPVDQPWRTETVAHRVSCLSRGDGFKRFRRAVRSDIGRLADAQRADGGWAPGIPRVGAAVGPTQTDHDQSALVLFALRDARFAGADIDRRIWRRAMQYWTDGQTFDGGYRDALEGLGAVGRAPDSAHTAVGAASLMAALDMAACFGGRRCSTYLASGVQLRTITDALAWLDHHYGKVVRDLVPVSTPPDPYGEPLGMQRLRSVLGVTRLGGKDHFAASARRLLEHFDVETGMFGARKDGQSWTESPSLVRTARALSILASGVAPTLCQRMVIGDTEGRAVYSTDAAHLTRFIAASWSRSLNWRRTSIDRDVRELVEVPLLVLSVAGPIDWSDDQWRKIRGYCFAGGTVVVDLSEGKGAERQAVVSALARVFPEFPLTDLPPGSPIYLGPTKIASPPSVAALSNGFRTFVLVPKESWSCHWHLFQLRAHRGSFDVMDNLLQHATDFSGEAGSGVESTYAVGSAGSYAMTAARIEVGGERPAYPDLLASMDRLMRDGYRIAVEPASAPSASDLLWVSVVGEAEPATADMQQIQSALSGGAYLLVDVVSGNPDWDEGFRARLTRLEGVTLTRLRRTSPVFTGDIPGSRGFDSGTVGFRAALRSRFALSGRCDLYEIRRGDRSVGVYSAYDLASGIGYQYFAGCRGPTPASTRGLVTNVFLAAYAEKQSR